MAFMILDWVSAKLYFLGANQIFKMAATMGNN